MVKAFETSIRRSATRSWPSQRTRQAPADASTSSQGSFDARPWNPWLTPSASQALPALGRQPCQPPRQAAVQGSSSRAPAAGGSEPNGGRPSSCRPLRELHQVEDLGAVRGIDSHQQLA